MKTIILSAAVTVLTLVGAACSKSGNDSDSTAAKTPVVATGQSASKSEIAPKTPEDWIIVQDKDYIPVIDDMSRKLQSARKAFMMKDPATAAADIRATADLLSKETSGASPGLKQTIDVTMKQLSALAADLDSKRTVEVKRFDAVLAAAHRADLERDWLVLEESSWYPYIEEPDHHFQNAHQSLLAKDYEKAAQEIRKGEAFVKLEASRASGDVKPSLNSSVQELEKLAVDARRGTVKDVAEADNTFRRADHALAQSHQVKAKESWAKKESVRAGYEMKAAALLLEQSADWAGSEAKTDVSAVVRDTRMLAGKLTEGSRYAVEEVDKGIDDLGHAISDLGRKPLPGK
jgi:hypothetical protein